MKLLLKLFKLSIFTIPSYTLNKTFHINSLQYSEPIVVASKHRLKSHHPDHNHGYQYGTRQSFCRWNIAYIVAWGIAVVVEFNGFGSFYLQQLRRHWPAQWKSMFWILWMKSGRVEDCYTLDLYSMLRLISVGMYIKKCYNELTCHYATMDVCHKLIVRNDE